MNNERKSSPSLKGLTPLDLKPLGTFAPGGICQPPSVESDAPC
jgi:hypothetical protein